MKSAQNDSYRRHVGLVANDRLRETPVLLLEGPRSVGKTTLLREIAHRHSATILDLDDPTTRESVSIDAHRLMNQPGLVCIDEYQRVPEILDFLKVQLNASATPGQFVLAGSTQQGKLPAEAQALTGRISRLQVLPLSQGELRNTEEHWLELALRVDEQKIPRANSTSTRSDYVAAVSMGGFPLAIAAPTLAARNRWIDDYLSLTLERDVRDISNIRRTDTLRRVAELIAGDTGQVLNIEKLAQRANLSAPSATNYLELLERVFLLRRLPAWGTTISARTAARPKLHYVDSAIAMRQMKLTPAKLDALDPAATTDFGRLLETFVCGEIFKQASWLDNIINVGHWRNYDNNEVDLVVEREDGKILAIEVKAGTRVPGEAFTSMKSLRNSVGDRFLAGVVLYLGERAYEFEQDLYVLPLDTLWNQQNG